MRKAIVKLARWVGGKLGFGYYIKGDMGGVTAFCTTWEEAIDWMASGYRGEVVSCHCWYGGDMQFVASTIRGVARRQLLSQWEKARGTA